MEYLFILIDYRSSICVSIGSSINIIPLSKTNENKKITTNVHTYYEKYD